MRRADEDVCCQLDTTYAKEKLENIAKVVSTVPEGVKFIRKAERILEGRAKWCLKQYFRLGYGRNFSLWYFT